MKVAKTLVGIVGICLVGAVACVLLLTTQNSGSQHSTAELAEFQLFADKFEKSYSDDEFDLRLSIYLDNARRIAEHNAKPNTTYKLGHNFSSDLTAEEFERLYTNPMLISLKAKTALPV
ncbi:MAG: hypothetical protein V2I33_19105 [Kangiellaceae bacterium]|jgi:hypothetical protein|nr:hypothetical protein [Kangiellaceae bacterium]